MLYDWSKPKEALEEVKNAVLTSMKAEENWYVKHRGKNAYFSRSIRTYSILLFSLGILWPIISPGLPSKYNPDFDIGYISLALGGILLLLDKYLGVSSGYVRFYIAELDIKKHTHEFMENWNAEIVKTSVPLTTENILALLATIKKFREAVFTTIQVETGAWANEFQTQTGELYELFKQKQNEYEKPANISVLVENYHLYSHIEIGIDNEVPVNLNDNTSIIFRNVSLQPHVIKIRATNRDKEIIAFSKNIDVSSGKTSDLTMVLP